MMLTTANNSIYAMVYIYMSRTIHSFVSITLPFRWDILPIRLGSEPKRWGSEPKYLCLIINNYALR